MKIKLIKISFILIFVILVVGVLYWYLNYQVAKPTPTPSAEEGSAKEEIKETTKTEETADEGIKSIPLEKPPFIK